MSIRLCLLLLGLLSQISAASAEAEWNVLFYLNGKNNLQYEMQEWVLKNLYHQNNVYLKENRPVNLPANVNVLVEYGTMRVQCNPSDKAESDLGLCDRNAKRFKLQKESSILTPGSQFQNLGNVDMGDYRSLIDFVAWSKRNFPAKKTLIYIFDHGDSYSRSHSGMFSFDEVSGNAFNPHQIAIAMEKIKAALGKSADLFVTDMCVVGSIEAIGQMAGSLKYYVASRENVHGYSVNVVELLRLLQTEPSIDPKRFAYKLTVAGSSFRPATNFSSYNIENTDAFAASLNSFVTRVLSSPVETQAALKAHIRSCRYSYIEAQNSVDFENFLFCLYTYPGLKDDIGFKNLRASFLNLMYIQGKDSRASGMSIWYGEGASGKASAKELSDYRTLRFDRFSKWSYFIEWLSR